MKNKFKRRLIITFAIRAISLIAKIMTVYFTFIFNLMISINKPIKIDDNDDYFVESHDNFDNDDYFVESYDNFDNNYFDGDGDD